MPVQANQIITIDLTPEIVSRSIDVSKKITNSIIDRADLHQRDFLERFFDCLMGELAEQVVITWLINQNKYAVSAVDKTAATPDLGHDIWLKDLNGGKIRASIKSSLSATKNNPMDILNTFTLATNSKELRDINIQVYFWLSPWSTPRITVPSLKNAGIFAWAAESDLSVGEFAAYKGEERMAPRKRLAELRPMSELLTILT